MNRLYAVESTPTLTGAKADHRLPHARVRRRGLRAAARRGASASASARRRRRRRARRPWIAAVAKDLQAHRGTLARRRRRVPAGGRARARARDEPGARQRRRDGDLRRRRSKPRRQDQAASLADLATAMDAGQVELLVILGGNPVFTRAGGPEVRRAAGEGRRSPSTTASTSTRPRDLCHWNVADTHPLETWGDARAYDGTVTLIQPLIAPLYDGRSAHEVAQHARRPVRPHAARDRQGLLDARVRRRERLDVPRRGRQAFTNADSSGSTRCTTGSSAARRSRTAVRRRRSRRRRARAAAGAAAAHRGGSAPQPAAPRRRQRREPAAATRPPRLRAAAPRRRRPPPSGAAPAPRGGLEIIFRPDPDRLGRPLRQQRLAAGTAQAADEGHVGRHGLDQPAARRASTACATATSSSCATAATRRGCRSSVSRPPARSR